MIRFPAFEPDRARFEPSAANVVLNAQPTRDGWGPLPDLSVLTEALPAACRGAVFVRTDAGSYRIFAGTATALYELNLTDYTWTDLTGTTTPAVPTGDTWWFERFGNNLLCGNLGTDAQFININSGTVFADLAGSPPRSKFAVTAGEYLLLVNLLDNPRRCQTSGIADASFWTVGERGCDFQDFPDGGILQGAIGAERGAILFQESKIRQVTIASTGDYSFTTQVVNPDRGVVAPQSIAQIGPGQFFYLSSDGFFTGIEGRPIGAERVDDWFQSVIDTTKISSVVSVVDPFNKLVWSKAQMPTGVYFLIGYNWQLDRWCMADSNVTDMMPLVTPGISWDALGDLYASIDEVTEPFDSALFAGGLPRFAAFDTDNKMGFFTGTAREATLETADIELNPGARSFLRECRVYTDATDFSLSVGTQNFHGDAHDWTAPVFPYAETKACHFRKPGRLHRFKMDIPAGVDWRHVVGVEALANREGTR